MKNILFASIFLLTLQAMACPDLSGSFPTCRSINGQVNSSSDLVITQGVQNGITIYSVTSTDDETSARETENYVADGITRTQVETDTDTNMQIIQTSTVKCQGSKVIINNTYKFGDMFEGALNMEIKKVGNALHSKTTGNMFGETIDDTQICE